MDIGVGTSKNRSDVARAIRKYHGVRAVGYAGERLGALNTSYDMAVAKSVDEVCRSIEEISALTADDLGDIIQKIEVWVAEVSLIDGVWETLRHEDQLVFSALRDLKVWQSTNDIAA